MRFFTRQQSDEWLRLRKRTKPKDDSYSFTRAVPYPARVLNSFSIAREIAVSLSYRQPVLLWVVEWTKWPSCENWHVYYRLRQSYGNYKMLEDEPGHLFLEHEREDLASFLQLTMLNGWDAWVLPHADYVNAFLSHEESIKFFSNRQEELDDICTVLRFE